MIKSVSIENEHLQDYGECTERDETYIRENRDLLQCFNQEMKVCSKVTSNICF